MTGIKQEISTGTRNLPLERVQVHEEKGQAAETGQKGVSLNANIRELPSFSGEGKSVRTAMGWLSLTRRIVKLRKRHNGEADNHLLQEIACSLTGEASIWFDFHEKSIHSVDEFFQIFSDEFLHPANVSAIQDKFENLRQGPRSVTDYATEFQELWDQLDQSMYPEAQMIRRFAHGLRRNIESYLSAKLYQMTSLQQVVVAGLNVEATLSRRPGRENVEKTAGSISYQEKMKKRGKNNECFKCGNQGHYAKECMKSTGKGPRNEFPTGRNKDVMSPGVKEDDEESVESVHCSLSWTTTPHDGVGKKLTVGIKVCDRVIEALLHTGTDCNLIASMVTDRLRNKIEIKQLKKNLRLSQVLAGYSEIIREYVDLPIEIPSVKFLSKEKIRFLIVPLEKYEAILGIPFIEKFNVSMAPYAHWAAMEGSDANILCTSGNCLIEEPCAIEEAELEPSEGGYEQIDAQLEELEAEFRTRFAGVFEVPAMPKLPPDDAPKHYIKFKGEE